MTRRSAVGAGAKRIRARVGDIFTIPITDGERVIGQVIASDGPQFLVVVFRSSVGGIDEAFASGIDLGGIVFDAKFRNGDWPILANGPPVEVREPWFVIGHPGLGNVRLENFDGSSSRMASVAEAAGHGHRNIASSMVLQIAAAASHGHRPWQPELEHLRHLGAELRGNSGVGDR